MQSFNPNPEHIMKDVYSYPFPEVRDTLRNISVDPEFMLNTLQVVRAKELIKPYDFGPELYLPARLDGSLDLDEIHTPVIERISARQGESIKGLGDFACRYPTPGSSQSMFTLIAEWHAQGKLDSVAVVNGEYEGYEAYASSLNVPVTKYDELTGNEPRQGEVWFTSNPSARDGNWIDEGEWQQFLDEGHDVVYDAAYVGLTAKHEIDVAHDSIKAILTSPSKIFGAFRYRNTGVTYTREPVASMYGSKWFKDVPALLDTLKLYETFGPSDLHDRYAPVQEAVCKSLAEFVGVEPEPSDVLLLASTDGPVNPAAEQYKRNTGKYRFGLTKLFEDFEQYKTQ